MIKTKNILELGNVKKNVESMLFKDETVRQLLGDGENIQDARSFFREHCKTHLFVDDTLTEKGSFIFFDTSISDINYQTKTTRIHMIVMCHRDLLDVIPSVDGLSGNRADMLAEAVSNTLLSAENTNQFGIGELSLEDVDIYNSKDYYGRVLIFEVKNFR